VRLKFAIVLAAALAAGACDKKAEGQVVAIVNGEEISAAELNAELRNINLPQGADAKQARAALLQSMIDRRVISQQAREEGIDKSPEFLNQQRRMTEDLLIRLYGSRQTNTNQLPSEQQVAQYIAANPRMFADRQQWNLDQLRFPMPTDPQVVKRLDGAQSMQDIAKILADAGITATPAKTKLDTAIIPADIYGRVATLPPGRPFIFPVGGQGIASTIASREPSPLIGDAARPLAVAAIRRQQSSDAMQRKLKTLRQAAKVEYQKGYAPPTAR
jgi:EpsD family peptidyl-prolyl cis-trans isomerase